MNKIKNIFALLALAIMVCCSACKLDVNQKAEPETNNEPKLVHIKPILQLAAARTAMVEDYGIVPEEGETYEEALLRNMKNFRLYWATDKESMLKDITISYTGSYSTVEALSENSLIPEGTYCFKLKAYVGSNSYSIFSSVVENVTISLYAENEIYFTMTPDSYNYTSQNVEFTFRFPAGTNPSLESCKINRYTKTDNYTKPTAITRTVGSDIKPVVVQTPVSEDESVPVMTFSINLSDDSGSNYNYTFDFVFYNTDETTEEVTGIFKYSTAARLSNGNIVKEDFTIPRFLNTYKLIYHVDDSTTVTKYYAPALGYALYMPETYTWFTDEACETLAQAAAPATTKGDKNFYRDTEKNYKILTVKDIATGDILTTQTVNNGNYYRLMTNGVGNNTSSLTVNLLENKEGCYISGYYFDTEKTEKVSMNSNLTLSKNTTIYVDYKLPNTLTVKDVETDEVLATVPIENNKYTLARGKISSDFSSSEYSNSYAIAYYVTDKTKQEIVEMTTYENVEDDVVVYAIQSGFKEFTLNKDRAYKLEYSGENFVILNQSDWDKDNAGKNLWSKRGNFSSSGTYTMRVYYGPENLLLPFELKAETVEIVADSSEPKTPSVGKANGDKSKYIETIETELYAKAYSFYLEKDITYHLQWIDSSGSSDADKAVLFPDFNVDNVLYIIGRTSSYMTSKDDGNLDFKVNSTGLYDVYVVPYSSGNQLKGAFHIYEDPYQSASIGVSILAGDVEINYPKDKDGAPLFAEDGTLTFTADGEYSSYEWKMGDTVLGTDAEYVFNPNNYLAGESYQIVLTCNGKLVTEVEISIPADDGAEGDDNE